MKTYVEYQGKKFDTISDAIEYAEEIAAETAEIDVYDSSDNCYLEGQTAKRNPYSNDLVYITWGVFFDDNCDNWIGEINSYDEAYEMAINLKKQNPESDIFIQAYTQTLSENIENIDDREYI